MNVEQIKAAGRILDEKDVPRHDRILKGGEAMAREVYVNRPFVVEQDIPTLNAPLYVKAGHEGVDRISLEINHPLWGDDVIPAVVLDVKAAKAVRDVLGALIEEQEQKALAIFMAGQDEE